MTKVTDALETNGPLTNEDLPHRPNPRDRMKHGVRAFKVTGSQGSGKAKVPRGSQQVYYLERLHSPHEVVAAWLDANPRFLDVNKPWAAYRTLESKGTGDVWKRAARQEIEERTGENVFHGKQGNAAEV